MACIAKRRGKWVIDFYDNQGKRRWKTLPEGTTKGKAKELLREIEDQLDKGVYIPDKKVPLFSEVSSDWLEFKKANLRASTWEMYRGHLQYHFEEIHNLKINRITTAIVEKFITFRQTSGYNLTTLRKLIVTFNQVMKYAVRHKYIDHNPVNVAERPRGKSEHTENKEIRILSPDEIRMFLDSVKNQKYRTLFMVAVMSGTRQGELLGLKWDDIDWTTCQIQIQRTYNKGTWYKPKTRTSYRKINLGPCMINELKKWKLACPPNEMNLMFPNPTGAPLSQSNMLRRYFKPALKAASIPEIRFHDLRHTYASLLIDQGENIKYIQNQLGHSSPSVTLDVYAHLLKPVNQEAAHRLENSIFSESGSGMVAGNKKEVTLKVVTS